MSTCRRFGVVLAGATILVALGQAAASDRSRRTKPAPEAKAPVGPEVEISDNLVLRADGKAARALRAAEGAIELQAWEAAIEILQALLDQEEDVFVKLSRKDEKGQVTVAWVSRHAMANRLIGSMSAKGLEVYEQTFGPEAAAVLDQARKAKDDRKLLADVAVRYQHTRAGAEAIDLLGTYYLDRGEYVTADRCFAQLLEDHRAGKLKAVTLYKAALAFGRAGDDDNGEKAWKLLTARVGKDGVRVGKGRFSVAELRKELDKVRPDQPRQSGGTPYLDDVQWNQPTIRENQTRTWVEQGVSSLEMVGQPVLPAFFPIAATPRTDQGRVPLVVYRSYWGVHAIELKTGKLYWETQAVWSMDHMLGKEDSSSAQKLAVLDEWWSVYQQSRSQSVLFDNSALGTLSTDGTRVYAVDDLALPPHADWLQQLHWGSGPQGGPLEPSMKQNKLLATELESGKLLWELGGGEGDRELAESYFLGPPLPLDGKLYVLNERKSNLRLLCLDPSRKGSIRWIQKLGKVRTSLDRDPGRRMQAARLAYGNGILVCLTNAGAVFGVDVLTHEPAWAYAYRKPEARPRDADKKQMIRPWAGTVRKQPNLIAAWKTAAPVIHDGKVAFAAPDGSGVYCLNLRSGTPRWTAERRDDLYLAGVYNGKVLLVGKGNCRALSLADGKQLWHAQTGLPSGQGAASRNVYYLPLKSGATSKVPEVCAIDINTGRIIGHSRSRPDREGKRRGPGNLLFVEGEVISQGVDSLTAFPQLEAKLKQMDKRLQANPKDPAALTERGEMKLDKGDLDGAAKDLHTALVNKPPANVLPKTRAKLFDTLTWLLKNDFDRNEHYLDEYEDLCKVPVPNDATEEDKQKLLEEEQQRMANLLALTAKGREKQGRLVEAFDAYMKFGALGGSRELVASLDDPTLKARPDAWAQGRIAALLGKAKPEERKRLEDKINKWWEKVRKARSVDELRAFIRVIGPEFKAGKEARLLLAELLMGKKAGFLKSGAGAA